jgi:hypothetical protein
MMGRRAMKEVVCEFFGYGNCGWGRASSCAGACNRTQLLRGQKGACDCVCKINRPFAFLFPLFHVRKIQAMRVPVLSGSHSCREPPAPVSSFFFLTLSKRCKYQCCPVLTFEENLRSQFQAFFLKTLSVYKQGSRCIHT